MSCNLSAFSINLYIVWGTGIAYTFKKRVVAFSVAVLVLHHIPIGDDAFLPMVEAIVAF